MALRSFPNRYLFSLHSKVTSLFSIRYILEIIFARDEETSECKTGENIAYAELQKALFYCKRKKYLLLFISVRELIQDIRFYDLLNEYRVDFRCVDFPWFCRENLQLIKAVMLYEKLSS